MRAILQEIISDLIPTGSDTSGKVIATHVNDTEFVAGEYVVSRFTLPAPVGGCAEYRMVETKLTAHCPNIIPPTTACGLPASAVAAKKIVGETVKQGDRVLVIGGSGGVGTSVLQYCRPVASHIAAVSTQRDLCSRLGADAVLDYRNTKWWEVTEYKNDPFDVVIDLVNGDNWTRGGRSGTTVQRKGIYALLIPGVCTEVQVHGVWDLMRLSFEWLWATCSSRLNPRIPKLVMADGLEKIEARQIAEVLQDVVDGRLNPVLDPASPFPFTEEGVRDAMRRQKSTHAHGKVVIIVAKE